MSKKYIKVEIKGPEDLPKDGQYIVHYKKFSDNSPQGTVLSYINSYNTEQLSNWMNNIDWYLIEEPEDALKDDLKQYITNLLYAARDLSNLINDIEFDKWVYDQIENIDGFNDYLKSK